MRGLVATVAALIFAATMESAGAHPLASPREFCSLSGGPPPFSIARTQNIVAESEVIVRATVLGPASSSAEDAGSRMSLLAFAVDEVLRGGDVPDTLRFAGAIVPEDSLPLDYEEDVPHRSHIRRWGGDCMATTYQAGGQYLLLLKQSERSGTLDPYWEVLAPTNNQIRGADDRWVQWVRTELARNPRRR